MARPSGWSCRAPDPARRDGRLTRCGPGRQCRCHESRIRRRPVARRSSGPVRDARRRAAGSGRARPYRRVDAPPERRAARTARSDDARCTADASADAARGCAAGAGATGAAARRRPSGSCRTGPHRGADASSERRAAFGRFGCAFIRCAVSAAAGSASFGPDSAGPADTGSAGARRVAPTATGAPTGFVRAAAHAGACCNADASSGSGSADPQN